MLNEGSYLAKLLRKHRMTRSLPPINTENPLGTIQTQALPSIADDTLATFSPAAVRGDAATTAEERHVAEATKGVLPAIGDSAVGNEGENVHTKKAVLFGMDYTDNPQNWPTLCGTKNDCRSIAALLMDQYGYKEEDVTVILEDPAVTQTKERLFQELAKLEEVASSGVEIFFMFSGHGESVKDVSGDEEDGMDEGLCMYDGIVLDDDLTPLLGALTAKGAVLTGYFDCCFAGGMLDVDRTGSTLGGGASQTRRKSMAGPAVGPNATYFFAGLQSEKTVDSIMAEEDKETDKTNYVYHGQFTQWVLKAHLNLEAMFSNQQLFDCILSYRRTDNQQLPTMVTGRPKSRFLSGFEDSKGKLEDDKHAATADDPDSDEGEHENHEEHDGHEEREEREELSTAMATLPPKKKRQSAAGWGTKKKRKGRSKLRMMNTLSCLGNLHSKTQSSSTDDS